ncbi:hypothetical protein [Saccharothrix deserti]|uniref:hypothetical protein n=1 Tax=Saccharothrix deserti TaxID=2593674 RepID=UPI00131BC0B0|nr:hypothetical protein [Saccharothrix deserti]
MKRTNRTRATRRDRSRPAVTITPGTHPDDFLNTPRPDAVVHVSPGTGHKPVPIDLETVTTLLYLSAMDRAVMDAVGPDHLAEYVLRSCEDPAVRVPEVVALVASARANGHVIADYYAQAEEFAPAVLAVFARAVDSSTAH